MITKEKNGIKWLEFHLLQGQPVAHGVFLRQGGYSPQPYASLNFSFKVGDDHEHVKRNIESAKHIISCQHLVLAELAHGITVQEIIGQGCDIEGPCDILATRQQKTALAITHADCQAAILYDPVQHALLNVHAGWRGNVQNIYRQAVTFMKERYDCRPEDILACISPSLGPKHAEFVHYHQEFPESMWTFFDNHHADLWTLSEKQLKQEGIVSEHIEIARICTFDHPQDFFSYRRDKTCGRNATIATLR